MDQKVKDQVRHFFQALPIRNQNRPAVDDKPLQQAGGSKG